MALNNVEQPQIIRVTDDLRLRRFDGNYDLFLPGYQNPVVYQNSEGIFEKSKIPNMDYVRRMCQYLERVGELYYIEARVDSAFIPIGDVTIKEDNPPIAIWVDEFRGMGIGTMVMQVVIDRLKSLGYHKINGSTVYKWNTQSQKMHERLGFSRVAENEKEIIYELQL